MLNACHGEVRDRVNRWLRERLLAGVRPGSVRQRRREPPMVTLVIGLIVLGLGYLVSVAMSNIADQQVRRDRSGR